MTKGEYCKSKGLHTSFPNFNSNDELTEDFKNAVDSLVDSFGDIYNEDEEENEECKDCRRWTCLECPYADI